MVSSWHTVCLFGFGWLSHGPCGGFDSNTDISDLPWVEVVLPSSVERGKSMSLICSLFVCLKPSVVLVSFPGFLLDLSRTAPATTTHPSPPLPLLFSFDLFLENCVWWNSLINYYELRALLINGGWCSTWQAHGCGFQISFDERKRVTLGSPIPHPLLPHFPIPSTPLLTSIVHQNQKAELAYKIKR